MERKPTPSSMPGSGAVQNPAAQKAQPRWSGPSLDLPEQEAAPSAEMEESEVERIERIWNERAYMAKVDTGGENQDEQVTVVLVRLGRELLGLEVQYVYDIRIRESITRVPRVPGWVVGVTNLRGNILSVINLCKYFGLPGDPASSEGENHGLLVIVQTGAEAPHAQNNGAMEIVFLVDDVLGVETLPIRQSGAESGLIHSLRPEYIQFIGERKAGAIAASIASTENSEVVAQRHVVVLNIENLMADPRLIIHDEIA